MIINTENICEYLRVYARVFSSFINSHKRPYDIFSDIVEKNETTLTIDDYNTMLLIKDFVSLSSVLFYKRDEFSKGLNGVDNISRNEVLENFSTVNRTCLENFTDKDIIFYIRNALAHNSRNLYELTIDKDKTSICIKLQNTIATKGENRGNNIPFEVEFGLDDLISMSIFFLEKTKTLNITGVDFNDATIYNSNSRSIFAMLKEAIDTTYYHYTLLNQVNDNTKKTLLEAHYNGNATGNMDEFDNLKERYVKKIERVELTKEQRECIYNSMAEQIHKKLKNRGINPAMIRKFWTQSQMKETLGKFFVELFEYEALKVIPMGKEKTNNSVIPIIINECLRRNYTIEDTQNILINNFSKKGEVYWFFFAFNVEDPEEMNMFIKNIQDSKYLEKEALASYYRCVFENFVPEGSIVTINNKQYEADIIRNSFTHGRWYFDEEKDNWELFDNSKSRDKPDQYIIDRHITISYDDLQNLADQKYFEHVRNNQNQAQMQ